ncbi:MAG: hypothetical protein VKL39_05870 [Leptolyngbyaceae bacterium]|nr:hypothetical protein [Leptolyngbyaceae bacterium]
MKKTTTNFQSLSTALFLVQACVGIFISLSSAAVAAQPHSSVLMADSGHEHQQEHSAESTPHGEHDDSHETPHEDSHGDSHGEDAGQGEGHSDVHSEGHGDGHHHGSLDVSTAEAIPSVQLIVHDDPVNGWNLELVTENFDFAPERVNGESLINEGHAHLYINGEKVMRIYSHWHHLPELESGMNMVRVTLNANGHEELVNQGEVVAASVMVEVP